jgi:hypothetical protein
VGLDAYPSLVRNRLNRIVERELASWFADPTPTRDEAGRLILDVDCYVDEIKRADGSVFAFTVRVANREPVWVTLEELRRPD